MIPQSNESTTEPGLSSALVVPGLGKCPDPVPPQMLLRFLHARLNPWRFNGSWVQRS